MYAVGRSYPRLLVEGNRSTSITVGSGDTPYLPSHCDLSDRRYVRGLVSRVCGRSCLLQTPRSGCTPVVRFKTRSRTNCLLFLSLGSRLLRVCRKSWSIGVSKLICSRCLWGGRRVKGVSTEPSTHGETSRGNKEWDRGVVEETSRHQLDHGRTQKLPSLPLTQLSSRDPR